MDARHEKTEWKDRGGDRRRDAASAVGRTAIHRRRRVRLPLRASAGRARRRTGRPRLQRARCRGSVCDLADLERLFATVKEERGTFRHPVRQRGDREACSAWRDHARTYRRRRSTPTCKGTLFTVQKGLPLMGAGVSIILNGSSAGIIGTRASAPTAPPRRRSATSRELGSGPERHRHSSQRALARPHRTELAKEAVGEEGMEALGLGEAAPAPGRPTEIGAVAAFLASSDSSFMTGSEVVVDGGLAQI